jgi:hypothetical protein
MTRTRETPAGTERRHEPVAAPAWWRCGIADVEAAVAGVARGKATRIARSPGGRTVFLVAYGSKPRIERQANYSSAVGAGDPGFYARKPPGSPPTVLIVGTPHGQEVENIIGTLSLLRVAETGADLAGQSRPRLREALDRCRLLIVPLSNPDGRARCPYDSFVGVPVDEMTRIGQGTRRDGSLYGWPGTKARHPMRGDVGFLGAYFNDDGINLMHDEFTAPMAAETRALLRIARREAPEFILNLHSHGHPSAVLPSAYVPRVHKEVIARFAAGLMERLREKGLPAGEAPRPREDGEAWPPPSFNLTSALHHVCGGVSLLFECPHGLAEPRYSRVTHEQILEIQMTLFEELLTFALEERR